MATDVVVRSPTVPAQEWFLISAQAEELARSDIIPSAYRRKPANIIVAALTGRRWGWDVLTAMRNGHVIEGTWGMKPEAMVGLVRLAGHSVKAEIFDDRSIVTGVRADNGDTLTYTFTVQDAEAAGLCKLVDGKPRARSSSGKALPWEQYPKIMCYWRAAAVVCRLLFADVTAGVHSVEEMAMVDTDGNVIEAHEAGGMGRAYEPVPLSEENLARFREACEREGLDPEKVLDEAFGEGVRPEPLTDADLPTMRDAFARVVQAGGPAGTGDDSAASPPAEGAGPSAGPAPTDDGRPATRAQVGKVKEQYGRLGVEDRLTQLSHSSELLGGVALATHNDLTFTQAQTLIELLIATESIG